MAANTRYENIQLLVLPPQFLQMQNKCSCPAVFGLSRSSRGRWAHTTGGYDWGMSREDKNKQLESLSESKSQNCRSNGTMTVWRSVCPTLFTLLPCFGLWLLFWRSKRGRIGILKKAVPAKTWTLEMSRGWLGDRFWPVSIRHISIWISRHFRPRMRRPSAVLWPAAAPMKHFQTFHNKVTPYGYRGNQSFQSDSEGLTGQVKRGDASSTELWAESQKTFTPLWDWATWVSGAAKKRKGPVKSRVFWAFL